MPKVAAILDRTNQSKIFLSTILYYYGNDKNVFFLLIPFLLFFAIYVVLEVAVFVILIIFININDYLSIYFILC